MDKEIFKSIEPTPEINSPEFFGIIPGEPGYEEALGAYEEFKPRDIENVTHADPHKPVVPNTPDVRDII